MWKKASFCIGLLISVLLLGACTPADVRHSISGMIRNASNGEPIAGATVLAGSYTAITDASGSFFIVVDESEPTVTGAFAAFKFAPATALLGFGGLALALFRRAPAHRLAVLYERVHLYRKSARLAVNDHAGRIAHQNHLYAGLQGL